MARGGPAHQGRVATAAPRSGALRWRLHLDLNVRASPVVGRDGTLYVGSLSELHAVSPAGELLWERAFGLGARVESTAAVGADGTVYVGANDGKLRAVSSAGEVRWAFATRGPVRSSPVIARDGSVVFGSDDGALYAVDPSGALRWRYATAAPVDSSPALSWDGTVYVGSQDGRLHAVDLATGQARFTRKLSVWGVTASPALTPDGAVVVGTDEGEVIKLQADSGAVLWRTRTGGPVKASPAVAEERVYVGADDFHLHALDLATGALAWRFRTGGFVRSSPVVAGDGTVLFGSDDGKLYAVKDDGARGTLAWSTRVDLAVRSSPALVQGGVAYVGTALHGLVAVGAPAAAGAAVCRQTVPAGCDCLCDRCLPLFERCFSDPGCAAILDCALAHTCRGTTCYQPDTCQDVILGQGGPYGYSNGVALGLDRCVGAECAGCP